MSNELLIKAITYQYPEQIPVGVGILPAAFIKHGDKMKKLTTKYQDLLGDWWQNYDPYRDMPERYRKGEYTDPWGCVWSNEEDGQDALVTGHPVKTREDIFTIKLPDGDIGLPHGFMFVYFEKKTMRD